MKASFQQEERMRWVLFWVFVSFFIMITLGTLGALFFELGSLDKDKLDILVYAFPIEIGAAIIALFYFVFGIERKNYSKERKVRLNLGEFSDVTNLVGKNASLSPCEFSGASLGEIETKVLNDQGPYLPLDLPPTTYSVYITVPAGEKEYSGSFVMGTYLVDMTEEKN